MHSEVTINIRNKDEQFDTLFKDECVNANANIAQGEAISWIEKTFEIKVNPMNIKPSASSTDYMKFMRVYFNEAQKKQIRKIAIEKERPTYGKTFFATIKIFQKWD